MGPHTKYGHSHIDCLRSTTMLGQLDAKIIAPRLQAPKGSLHELLYEFGYYITHKDAIKETHLSEWHKSCCIWTKLRGMKWMACKVRGCPSVTCLNRAPRFDWCVVKLGSNNKHYKDTCSNDIGLRLQISLTTPQSIVNIVWRTLWINSVTLWFQLRNPKPRTSGNQN
jgi:hypothetical protein